MVTSVQLEEQKIAIKQQQQALEKIRMDKIIELRGGVGGTQNIPISIRKRLNEDFQAENEKLKAQLRELRRVQPSDDIPIEEVRRRISQRAIEIGEQAERAEREEQRQIRRSEAEAKAQEEKIMIQEMPVKEITKKPSDQKVEPTPFERDVAFSRLSPLEQLEEVRRRQPTKPTQLGGIFFTPEERPTTVSEMRRKLSAEEQLEKSLGLVTGRESIARAEDITGVKDSGAVFIPSKELEEKKVPIVKALDIFVEEKGLGLLGEKGDRGLPFSLKEGKKETQELPFFVTVPEEFTRKGFRKGVGITEFLGEKVGLEDVGPKISKQMAEDIFIDLGKFAFFGPTLTTTAQAELALARAGKVTFKGTQQSLSDDVIKTDIRFRTGTGTKGTARGVTKLEKLDDIVIGRIKEGGDDILKVSKELDDITILGKTVTAGKEVKTGLRFPTGKVVEKPVSKFIGTEKTISVVKPSKIPVKDISVADDVFKITKDFDVTRTFGKGRVLRDIRGKKDITEFISVGVGLSKVSCAIAETFVVPSPIGVSIPTRVSVIN